MLSLSQKTA